VIRQALNPLHAQRFLQCQVDSRGVGLCTEHANRFFQQLLIKHKICTFHVYMVALSDGAPIKGDSCISQCDGFMIDQPPEQSHCLH